MEEPVSCSIVRRSGASQTPHIWGKLMERNLRVLTLIGKFKAVQYGFASYKASQVGNVTAGMFAWA